MKLCYFNDYRLGVIKGDNVVDVTDASFAQILELSRSVPVVVDLWAEWCGPCKMLIPVLNELATEYAGKVKIAKVNVDQAGMLASQYNVQSIPALFFFKGGQVVAQMVGARSKKDLKAQLDQIA